jgi:hypothetical protein
MATPSSTMDKSDVDMTEIDEEDSGANFEAGVIGLLDSPKVRTNNSVSLL